MNMQRTISPPEGEDYESDFAIWLAGQAAALRAGDTTRLDWPNLLEEIEALGRSERVEILSRLATIIEHLLKFGHGLNRDPASGWRRTIRIQRRDLARRLDQSPSLYNFLVSSFDQIYRDARMDALDAFEEHEAHNLAHYKGTIPEKCPFTVEQALDPDYLPDPSSV